MSSTLVYVPKQRAITPKIKTGEFRNKSFSVEVVSQYVTNSINTGNKIPSHEKHKAPISETNGPIFGTEMARNTEIKI